MNNFCEACGAPLSQGLKFCETCGHPVRAGAAAPDPVAAPTPPPDSPGSFCEHCGTRLSGTTKFCEACGQPAAAEVRPKPSQDNSILRILAAGTGLLLLGGAVVGLIWFFSARQLTPPQLAQSSATPPRTAAAPPGEAPTQPVPRVDDLSAEANSQALQAPAAPSAPAQEPSGHFKVGSKWLIDWQSQFRYRGFLHIQQQLEANKYFGRITVSFANNNNVRKTVSMDGVITIRGKDVLINCSNPSESWWDTDDFYLERNSGTMTGYNLDKRGRRGKAVFVFADEARFATFLRQEFAPETPAPRPPSRPAASMAPYINNAEVQEFVRNYYQATAKANIPDLLTYYADTVDYHAKGSVNKTFIKNDKEHYFRRWPVQLHELHGGLDITDIGEGVKEIDFLTKFQVKNNAKQVAGVAQNTWIIQKINGRLAIIDEKSKVLPGE